MTCPACNGELFELGTLGNRQHYRCRACGIDCSTEHLKPEYPCDVCGVADDLEPTPNHRDRTTDHVCAPCLEPQP